MTGKIFLMTIVLTAGLTSVSEALESGGQMSEPANLIDFNEATSIAWQVVNDGVMGGVSRGDIQRSDHGTGLFSGTLSMENNGGFASVRGLIAPQDLSAFSGLEIRIRGDGRTYQLRLRVDGRFDGIAYRAIFSTTEDEWADIRIPFTEFLPTFRGRILSDEQPLDVKRIAQVAFMVADKRPGRFFLEIDFVRPWVSPALDP
jgi:monofunctional biosynthetic peptidoglycan transglycosylase